MVNIENNTIIDNLEDKITLSLIDGLKKRMSSQVYSRSSGMNEMLARKIGNRFVHRGYHVKLIFFNNGVLQSLIVSKVQLSDTNAKMVYSEILG